MIAAAVAPPVPITEAAANCAEPANVVADMTSGASHPMWAPRATTPNETANPNTAMASGTASRNPATVSARKVAEAEADAVAEAVAVAETETDAVEEADAVAEAAASRSGGPIGPGLRAGVPTVPDERAAKPCTPDRGMDWKYPSDEDGNVGCSIIAPSQIKIKDQRRTVEQTWVGVARSEPEYGVSMFFTSYSDGAAPFAEDIVNTYNIVRDVEKLPDVAVLGQFLIDHGVRLHEAPTERDLHAVRRLRPILRSVFESGQNAESGETSESAKTSNASKTSESGKVVKSGKSGESGGADSSDEDNAVAVLNDVLASHHAVPYLTRHDGEPWHFHPIAPDAPPVDQLAAYAAAGLLAVIATSGLKRLHTCVGNRCAEVFVDVSRNQTRRYCSPLICGNRAHAAAHRNRVRTGTAAT